MRLCLIKIVLMIIALFYISAQQRTVKMSGLDIAFRETKCVNIRIDLTRDIPITLLNKYHNLSKKDRRMNLREIIYADDFPALADVFSEIVSGRQKTLNAHCRVRVGEDYRWVSLDCSVKKDTFNRSEYLTGTMIDVSEYLDASENEFQIDGTVKKKKEIVGSADVSIQDASLDEILGEDYLLRIQQALTVTGGVYSAIYNSNGELMLSPADEKGNVVSLKKFKHKITEEIRCSHNLMATWTVASDDSNQLEGIHQIHKVLAETVSQIANAILVLYAEMENSKTANQQLGSNIEQQILLNNIYTIILENKSAEEALTSVIQLVGEYLKLDRVSLYHYDSETGYTAINKEWSAKGIDGDFLFKVDENPHLMEELNYCDTFFSNSSFSETQKLGIKSFVVSQLAENGKFVGLIFYETIKNERIWSSADKKLLRNISQIISTMLIRCNMDIALKEQNNQLKRMAYTDPVLEIPNRAALDRDLQQSLNSYRPGAVISLKITNISTVNETFGHIHSDNLLKKISSYLNDLDVKGKNVYRFSGSVLMIILAGGGISQAREFLKTVTDRFSGSWKIDDEEHFLDMSAGVALYPDDALSCEGIYRCSTLALYRAAEGEKNSYVFYSKELEERAGAIFNAEQRLRRAVLNDMEGFSVSYMPIADSEGNITSLEAVVSWIDRENGKMPAGRVIKLAESIGIDEIIDSWVINNACDFLHDIIEITGYDGLVMNLNLTYHELRRSSVQDTINSAIEAFGLKESNIAVEIPEKAQLKIEGNFGNALNEFKSLGLKVVIDDFGREYMSLNALKSGMADVIKIRAEQFCGGDEFDRAALKSVIMLAHNRGISVCVKHIDNKEQFESAREFFADQLQGSYLFPCSDEESIKKIFLEYNASVAVPKHQ